MKRLEGVTICKEAVFFLFFNIFSFKPRSGRLEFVLMGV